MGIFAKKRGRLSQKWVFDTQGTLLSGPMVYDVDKDGRKEIVFGTKDGRIIMMDEGSDLKWTYSVKEDLGAAESFFHDAEASDSIASAPAIGDIDKDGHNEIIFGTEMGFVYCLDNKGMLKWKFNAGSPVRTSVLLHDLNDDDLFEIIFGCANGNLFLIGHNGHELWKFETGTGIESTPTVIPDTKNIVFGCHDGTIRCVQAGGESIWQFQTDDKVAAQPVIADIYGREQNNILVGSSDFYFYVLDELGELVWKYKTQGAILSKAAVADINKDGKLEVVFGSCDNNVYALDNEGRKIWSYETYFWVVAPPIIDDFDNDGKMEVIVGSYDTNIYVLDSEGVYALDYMPGLGGIVHQSGNYSEIMTHAPGEMRAKKIWQFKTAGFVVGCALDSDAKNLIVNVKEGKVEDLVHQK